METKLTTRDFFRSPRRVAELIKGGQRITVTRGGKAFFSVQPAPHEKRKTIADFQACVFSDPKLDKDLSKKVDEVVYGT